MSAPLDPTDPTDLGRFVQAQEPVMDAVAAELQAGRKRTHWMWFVFPQLAGLGRSAMARRYAIGGLEEAAAYLAHPVLGPRLRQCTEWVLEADPPSVGAVFGYPDDLKFHSCMTLFARVAEPGSVFHRALDRFFQGRPDPLTTDRLGRGSTLDS